MQEPTFLDKPRHRENPSGSPVFYMETSAKQTGQGQRHIICKCPAQGTGKTQCLSRTVIPPQLHTPYGRILPEKAVAVQFLLWLLLRLY